MKEQGLLCAATATETLAVVAETATPPLTCSSNKDAPLSVNLSLLLSSMTKGCRVWGGGWGVEVGGVVRIGVVARSSEQVLEAVKIKGVCSASHGRFAVCLVAGDRANFKYQIGPTNEP